MPWGVKMRGMRIHRMMTPMMRNIKVLIAWLITDITVMNNMTGMLRMSRIMINTIGMRTI